MSAKEIYQSKRNLSDYQGEAREQAEAALEAQEKALGGKLYRIPAGNTSTFEKKVAKLNRKAAKLNCAEITYRVVETDEEERKVTGEGGVSEKRLYVWDYIVLDGSAPKVPGYRFLAALDHTIQEKEGDPVIIKQVPTIEEELDLSAYRTADSRCDHCQRIRSRNTTYLIEKEETGEIFKVGSSCLADFTGTNDPHRVASFLEYLVEFEEGLGEEGEDYSGSRPARLVHQYLTHVAACIRNYGWSPRSMSSPTADTAWSNIYDYGKRDKRGNLIYVPLKDEDSEIATKAVEWAKSIKGNSDFDHNLRTMANLKYMPKKGDGIVAYIVQGYVKDETKRIEREAEEARKAEQQKNAEPITEGRQEITGRVVNEYEREDQWGSHHKMTVLDDRGFTVNGTVPSSIWKVKKGDRVTFTATVKPKEGDDYYGWYKRPSKAEIIEEVAA
jgi:hypothetical protein